MKVFDLARQLISIKSITDSPHESEPIESRLISKKKGKLNLVAEIGKGKRSILLNSHFDVVPAKNQLFKPKVRQNLLFGRGAVDAKGPLAAMITAFIELSKLKIHGKVVLCCVCDEENSGEFGSRTVVKNGITSDYNIFGEPTDFNVIIAEKGFIRLKIKIFGKEAHAAYPNKGINAITLATKMIIQLQDLIYHIHHPLLSDPTFSVNLITGGKKINVVADYCEFCMDIRYLPNQSKPLIINQIKKIVDSIGKGTIEVISFGVPCETSEKSILVDIAAKIASKKTLGVNFATDARFFKNRDFIIFGPGKSELTHQEDEQIKVEDLNRAVEYYKKIVIKLLKYDDINKFY